MMNLAEALEWAADYAERAKLFEPVKNERGYNHDRWTPPSAAERTKIIMDLAREVVESERKGLCTICQTNLKELANGE